VPWINLPGFPAFGSGSVIESANKRDRRPERRSMAAPASSPLRPSRYRLNHYFAVDLMLARKRFGRKTTNSSTKTGNAAPGPSRNARLKQVFDDPSESPTAKRLRRWRFIKNTRLFSLHLRLSLCLQPTRRLRLTTSRTYSCLHHRTEKCRRRRSRRTW